MRTSSVSLAALLRRDAAAFNAYIAGLPSESPLDLASYEALQG